MNRPVFETPHWLLKVGFGDKLGPQQRHHDHAHNKHPQRRQHGGPFVLQSPAQNGLVALRQAVGGLVEVARDAANGFVVESDRRIHAMRMDARVMPDAGQHRVKRETHEHRDRHCGHDGDTKLMKKLANDALHETDG